MAIDFHKWKAEPSGMHSHAEHGNEEALVIQSRFMFVALLENLSNRMEEITNYFIDRQSSGFVEGLNNKIKVIKRRCYGILNIKHLFQRLYLDVEVYALFA